MGIRCRQAQRLIAVLVITLGLISTGAIAQRGVHVNGYTRKDGTYVAPHYRSAPDGNFYNNWSTKGNVNPYTGKEGTRVSPPGTGVGTYSLPPSLPSSQELRVQPNRPEGRTPSPLTSDAAVAPEITGDAEMRRVQARLKELGYYKMSVDGIWGPGSKAALRLFREDHHLGDGMISDMDVQRLLLAPEKREANYSYFTLGSHSDDVVRLQGTPTAIRKYEALGQETWSYGLSTVTIGSRDAKVIEWSNAEGNLKARMELENRATNSDYFTIGSHKDDVVRLQGTPTAIRKYEALGQETWSYGLSTVTIGRRDARVIEWSNAEGNLKARMELENHATNSDYFTIGSHKDDVVRLQGTPTAIRKYEALGQETWSYGFSTVTIGRRDAKVIEWSNLAGNLKARL